MTAMAAIVLSGRPAAVGLRSRWLVFVKSGWLVLVSAEAS